MLDGLRRRAERAKAQLGFWLMSAGLRLVGINFAEELAEIGEPDGDEPVPVQNPMTEEAAAMIAQPKPPVAKPPPDPPLEGSALARYHANNRRAM